MSAVHIINQQFQHVTPHCDPSSPPRCESENVAGSRWLRLRTKVKSVISDKPGSAPPSSAVNAQAYSVAPSTPAEPATLIQEQMKKSAAASSSKSSSSHRLLSDDGVTQRPLRRARFRWKDWLLGSRQGQWIFMLVSGISLVLGGAVLWFIACEDSISDYEHDWEGSVWFSWTMFFDPGTHTGMPHDDPEYIKTVSVMLSVFGFIYNLSFLGMVVELVRSTLEDWRHQRSRIVMTGHTLVLGWTGKTLFLLSELLHYALTQGETAHIVLMAERDEADMRKEIDSHFLVNGKVSKLARYISVRSGDPFDADHLDRVSAGSAREVIVLGYRCGQQADLGVVRVVIALAALNEAVSGRVVAEVQHQEYADALAGLLPSAEGICARISVNCVLCLLAVQPALGFTFISLLTSDGQAASLYSADVQQKHAGRTFADVSVLFPLAICVGVRSSSGEIIFNPPAEHVLRADEKIIFVARSQRAIGHSSGRQLGLASVATDTALFAMTSAAEAAEKAREAGEKATEVGGKVLSKAANSAINVFSHVVAGKKHISREEGVDSRCGQSEVQSAAVVTSHAIIVIAGWTTDLPEIITVLNKMLPPKTTIHVLSERSIPKRQLALKDRVLMNVELQHHVGQVTSLHSLSILPLQQARAILILSDESASGFPSSGSGNDDSKREAMKCDSACLACVQMVDGLLEGRFGTHFQSASMENQLIICEVQDPRADRVLARSQTLRQKAFFFRRGALETGLFHHAARNPTIFNSLLLLLAQSTHLSGSSGIDYEIAVVPISLYADGVERGDSRKHSSSTRANSHVIKNITSAASAITSAMNQAGRKCGFEDALGFSTPGALVSSSGMADLSEETTQQSAAPICNNSNEIGLFLSYWQVHALVQQRDGGILIGWQRFGEQSSAARSPHNMCRFVDLVPDVDRDEKLFWHEADNIIVLRQRSIPEESGATSDCCT